MGSVVRTTSQLPIVIVIAAAALPNYVLGMQSLSPVYIAGKITCNDTNLPGVIVEAESTATGKSMSTASDDQGNYTLTVPGPGSYRVRVELFGFSPYTRLVSVTDETTRVDFTLSLALAETGSATASPVQQLPPRDFSAARATRDSADAKPLSAEVPTDFSFGTGQLAQPVEPSSSTGRGRPVRESRVHGGVSYDMGNSALDASPYALHGIGAAKPQYAQNSFGASLGSTLPWGKKKAAISLLASYSGSRNGNPYNGFASVPTAAMRAGDFSGAPILSESGAGRAVTIFDPTTGQPFANNRIPPDRISPAAAALLRYIPLPSRDGLSQNSRFVSASHSKSDSFGLSSSVNPNRNSPVRNNFNASLGYHRSAANLPNEFPLLGGDSIVRGWNAKMGYTLTKGFFANSLNLTFNSTSSQILNHFHDDVAAALGISGVSRESFDWGLPSIAFTQFTGLRDVAPTLRADRNLSFTDVVSWSHAKHNLKWGGEFQRLGFNLRSSRDAAGSFTFTGFATTQVVNGTPAPGTGSDFADFLLGLPQKTHVQYADGAFSFHGNAWNLYFLDDWRIAKNVTLNIGVRYEYASPFSEAHGRLVTLDAPPDFSAVTVVPAGGAGPFSGRFPSTIVAPDRNNFAPRIGVAWRASGRLILRAGYSIDYDTSLYNPLAAQLALQPPFAVGQTSIAGNGQRLTLANGFPALQAEAVANNFAVARNLPLSYAQTWVLQLENELPHGFKLVTSYIGTNGTDLQMLRAPNRTATGLLLPNVAPFLWRTNEGSSILHSGSVAVQKRLASGLSFSASYMFSRSIDNVPALGDDTQIAQNDRALERDRGLSAFDQRHRLAVRYSYELPFGAGRHWLNGSAIGNQVLGDWSLTGSIHYASGFPLTPRVVGASADVQAGGYGALRPDLAGEPVHLSQPTAERFFNTGAFTAPLAGRYGDAGRNIIIGPSSFTFDAGLAKSFTIAERHNLLFQAKVTNLLNRPRFTRVDANLNSLSYGQITGVGEMRTVQIGFQYSF
jgi:hypothetical protein